MRRPEDYVPVTGSSQSSSSSHRPRSSGAAVVVGSSQVGVASLPVHIGGQMREPSLSGGTGTVGVGVGVGGKTEKERRHSVSG